MSTVTPAKTERCPKCEDLGYEPSPFRAVATLCDCCYGERVVSASVATAYRAQRQLHDDRARGEAPSKALIVRLEHRIEALRTLHAHHPCPERDFLQELLQEFHRLDRLAYRRACAADKPEPGA